MAKTSKRAVTSKEGVRELEQWQRDDARRLKALWDKRPKPRLSQAEFGATYEIGSQGMVWQYLHAHRALNLKAASGFAAGLNCQVSDFSPRLALEISKMATTESRTSLEHFTLIDRYRDAHHATGPGEEYEGDGEADKIAFREDWLRSKGWSLKHLKAVPARGHSMEPRIKDGDLVLVDTAIKAVQNGEIYAIRDRTGRRIKRLFFGGDGSLRIRSDNPAPQYVEEVYPENKVDQVEIIGRAVWLGGNL